MFNYFWYRKISSTLLFLLLTLLSCGAGNYSKFAQIDSRFGLPGTTVRCLMQDRNGFVWVGMEGEGLAKYDGHTFQLFTPENTDRGLCDTFIESLFEDDSGNIWIGTDKGASVIDVLTNTFRGFHSIEGDNTTLSGSVVLDIEGDSEGRLWFATNGGICYFKDDIFHQVQSEDPSDIEVDPTMSAIHVSDTGDIWVGSYRGLYRVTTDDRSQNLVRMQKVANGEDGLRIHAIMEDNQGVLWLGTDSGLRLFDMKTGELRPYWSDIRSNTTSEPGIRSIIRDKQGNLWVATWTDGIRVIDPIAKKQTIVKSDIRYKDSLQRDTIRALMMDSAGLIWIRSLNLREYQIYDPRSETFGHHRGSTYNETGLKRPIRR